MSAQDMTAAHLDSLVWEALPADGYKPFSELRQEMPVEAKEVRASLVRLMGQGLAELSYGRGFRQLHKVTD